jgi:DNA-binding NarL/FixJ family response regulator
MAQPIRVLIADDHPISRSGLRALLSTLPTVEVIGEAQNGWEATQLVAASQPDVVLMDLQMPVWNGLDATRQIKARWPAVKIVALTIRDAWRTEALAAGADAFLLKGCPCTELFAAVSGP